MLATVTAFGTRCFACTEIHATSVRAGRHMKIALVYPPTCDPTAPYLAVPMLTGFLRAQGVDVLPIDANVEAWDELLRERPLRELASRVERRIGRLEKK